MGPGAPVSATDCGLRRYKTGPDPFGPKESNQGTVIGRKADPSKAEGCKLEKWGWMRAFSVPTLVWLAIKVGSSESTSDGL